MLVAFGEEEKPTDTLDIGSCHADRVYIREKKTRTLLERFSGIKVKKGVKGFRQISKTDPLTDNEFTALLKGLETECSFALVSLVKFIKADTGTNSSNFPFQHFLHELSCNIALCGTFQIAGDTEIMSLLRKVVNGQVDLFDSTNSEALGTVQSQIPVLADVLSRANDYFDNCLPEPLLKLIEDILTKISLPFQGYYRPTSDDYPAPTSKKPLSFFPALPEQHGPVRYTADRKTKEISCRKESYKHPKLSPGVFTIFCRHGICYGFEAMTSHESPRHPFTIFKTRFSKAPRNIIYDNACHLHQYCLNREQHFFQESRFFVDRFHWKCHVGCSSGYCLDMYKTAVDVRNINSQINEQANAGLKHLQAQLAYMSPSNFMFHLSLFLAQKNMKLRSSQCSQMADVVGGLQTLGLSS